MPDVNPLFLASGTDTVTLAGVAYRFSPLTVDDTRELEAWVLARLPDPVTIARELARDQDPEVAKELLLTAYEDARRGARRLGSPEAAALLVTPEGVVEMFFLHGRRHQPALTRDDWARVLSAAVDEEIEKAKVKLAEGEGGALPDPKSPPSSPAPTGAPSNGASGSSTSPANTAGGPATSAS